MLLKKLIKNCPKNLFHVKVKGLSSDTRKLKKGEDVSNTDDIEDKQCQVIMECMKSDSNTNNTSTYKEMNKLAEMTMEKIKNQYLLN